jgi:dynein heavy chain
MIQAAREQWAETLWSNLNVQVLQEGIEGFLKNLRKMPRDVRSMQAARALESKMKEFRDSLPLFVDLKHDALRERYNYFYTFRKLGGDTVAVMFI